MYYGNDSDGNIIELETSDGLQDSYQEVFPEYPPDIIDESDLTDQIESTVSSGDLFTPIDYSIITYDELIDLLAAIPGYNVFPNTAAVSVFDGCFRNFGSKGDYIVLSGSDTSSTYMYWSEKSSVSGQTITLSNPVYRIAYETIRSGTNVSYQFNVSQVSDITLNVSSQLIYTNLLKGYPLLPSDDRGFGRSISLDYAFIICAGIVVIAAVLTRFRRDGK